MPYPSKSPIFDAADFSVLEQNTVLQVRLGGEWTVHTLQGREKELADLVDSFAGQVLLHLEGIVRLDTTGALFLNVLLERCNGAGERVRLLEGSERVRALLAVARPVSEERPASSLHLPGWRRLLVDLGIWAYSLLDILGQQLSFFGQFCWIFYRQLCHPSSFRFTSLVHHMDQAGLRAVPIVSLLTFLIGMVVAYMGAEELAKFGAQIFAVNLLEVTVMREMGVLITAIVVAGRSSSSFTAQIGAMVANEEVDAIRSMGLNPMELLVTPRVLALLLTLPFLVFIADLMALLGGALAIWYSMDMSVYAFAERYYSVCQLNNFFVGLVKAPFFALTIGIVGSYHGFNASRSAESVGFATTKSVVESIFLVIIIDAVFAVFCTTIGV